MGTIIMDLEPCSDDDADVEEDAEDADNEDEDDDDWRSETCLAMVVMMEGKVCDRATRRPFVIFDTTVRRTALTVWA